MPDGICSTEIYMQTTYMHDTSAYIEYTSKDMGRLPVYNILRK